MTDCESGEVVVSLQVSNAGTLPAPPSSVAVYAMDETGQRLVATAAVGPIEAETVAEGFLLTLTPADLGELGLRVVVDDDGTGSSAIYECLDDNNEARWDVSVCP